VAPALDWGVVIGRAGVAAESAAVIGPVLVVPALVWGVAIGLDYRVVEAVIAPARAVVVIGLDCRAVVVIGLDCRAVVAEEQVVIGLDCRAVVAAEQVIIGLDCREVVAAEQVVIGLDTQAEEVIAQVVVPSSAAVGIGLDTRVVVIGLDSQAVEVIGRAAAGVASSGPVAATGREFQGETARHGLAIVPVSREETAAASAVATGQDGRGIGPESARATTSGPEITSTTATIWASSIARITAGITTISAEVEAVETGAGATGAWAAAIIQISSTTISAQA
jgi:hypothetical protein